MACVTRLKDDTRFLECTFPRTHKLFQISSASVDEVVCRFVVTLEQDTRPGQAIVLTANFGVRCAYSFCREYCLYFFVVLLSVCDWLVELQTLRTQDASDPGHFGTSLVGPNCPDRSALVPKCPKDSSDLSAELSCPKCRTVRS